MKLLSLVVLLYASLAWANEKGNGGDICENRIASIGDDLKVWIEKGGASALTLAVNVSIDIYERKMLAAISGAKIACTTDKIWIGHAEKTCKNWMTSDGATLITCNAKRFMETSEADQYILVHHEYAGISGLEINSGETSDYSISNQITGFLEDQIVKKLVVKPKPAIGKYVCAGTCEAWEIHTLSITGWTPDSLNNFRRLCDSMGANGIYPAGGSYFHCNYTIQKSFPVITSPWNQEINAKSDLHNLCYANNEHSNPTPTPPATGHSVTTGRKINDNTIQCRKL